MSSIDSRRKNIQHAIGVLGIDYGMKNPEINHYHRPVQQFTLTGEFINEFNSIKEAAQKTGIAKTSIGNAVRGSYKTARGCLWK